MFLNFVDTVIDPSFNTTFVTQVFKLNSDGGTIWGKSYSGANFRLESLLPDGRLLATGTLTQNTTADGLVVLLQANGNLDAAQRFDRDANDFVFAMGPFNNRLYYTLHSSPASTGGQTAGSVFIGSSNLQLGDFTWKEYSRADIQSAVLMPDADNSRLLFTAFNEATQAAEVVTLNLNLVPDADCELFPRLRLPFSRNPSPPRTSPCSPRQPRSAMPRSILHSRTPAWSWPRLTSWRPRFATAAPEAIPPRRNSRFHGREIRR